MAAQAGISREALYRSLSPKGNPTLKSLPALSACDADVVKLQAQVSF